MFDKELRLKGQLQLSKGFFFFITYYTNFQQSDMPLVIQV